ncbi:MAG: hypothetical protein NTZ78_15360 [Candidatus Aureabacteria bacterium]|nr:hypothetical protein [Candidatus Auribacterota bacterium]
MKQLITAALSLIFMVGVSCVAIAGSLEPSGPPTAGSGMYTLQNLYDYLTSGTALTVQTSFQEPTSGPTAGSMKTTKEIGDDIAALFGQCPVMAANVESGVKFFCTQSGSWGIQTGTALLMLTPTPTPTETPTLTPTETPQPWGPTSCASEGGKWLATQSAPPDDYGCWFYDGVVGKSCDTICSERHFNSLPLHCAEPRTWNDNPATCEVCHQWHPLSPCYCCHVNQGGMPVWQIDDRFAGGGYCYPRNTDTNPLKECSWESANQEGPDSVNTMLCVCEP